MSCTVFSRLLFHPPMQSTGFNAWKIREGREQQPERAQLWGITAHLHHSTKQSIRAAPIQPVPKSRHLSGKGRGWGHREAPPGHLLRAIGARTSRSQHSLRPDVEVVVAGVAHLTEAGDKEVVAAVIRWGVLFDVGKLHELGEKKEGVSSEAMAKIFLKFLSKPTNICGLQQCDTGLFTTAARCVLGMTSQAARLHPGLGVPKREPATAQPHRAPAAPRPGCRCCKPHRNP